MKELDMQRYHEHHCYISHCTKENAMVFPDFHADDGIVFKPLKEEHIPIIEKVYPLRNETTVRLFRKLIRLNPSLGAFTPEGRLIAFCTQFLTGEVMALQVIDKKYKRKGIGTRLSVQMGKHLSKNNYDCLARIASDNEAPVKFMEKYSVLGVQIIGEMYHIVFGPKDKNILSKL